MSVGKPVRVTRPVSKNDPHNYAGRKVEKGEVLYTFHGPTYGCVDSWNGIALSEVVDEYPFFEFPLDAVERADNKTLCQAEGTNRDE
jgi:hypothetical protein